MKVASSLKTLKSRDRNCQVVRRRGLLYVTKKRTPGLTRVRARSLGAATTAVLHR